MSLPWLRLLDAVIGLAELARGRPSWGARFRAEPEPARSREPDRLDGRLADVIASALKEALDRDRGRLELDRARRDEERQRAERTRRLEALRQTGEREIARSRLVIGVALAGLVGPLVMASRLAGGPSGARVAIGCGWVLLLGAIAAAFAAQSAIGAALSRAEVDDPRLDDVVSGVLAGIAPWLAIIGLTITGLGVLVG